MQKPNSDVLHAFRAIGEPVLLPGGEGRTFRAGDRVLKHIHDDSRAFTNWNADLFSGIQENGFRVSRPIATPEGGWITDSGWTAWTFLEGEPASTDDHIDESIKAIQAFRAATKEYPRPDFLGKEDTPYTRADRYAWGAKPTQVRQELQLQVDTLYALREPLDDLGPQLIHGDLNPENILLAPSLPPAIIDMPPYWRPADFALAVYGYWISPWRNKPELLTKFPDTHEFKQLLVRAAIRMLLIMSEFNNVHDEERFRRATAIVRDFASA